MPRTGGHRGRSEGEGAGSTVSDSADSAPPSGSALSHRGGVSEFRSQTPASSLPVRSGGSLGIGILPPR